MLFFYNAILATKGYSATINKVLLTIDFLLKQFKTAKCTYCGGVKWAVLLKSPDWSYAGLG